MTQPYLLGAKDAPLKGARQAVTNAATLDETRAAGRKPGVRRGLKRLVHDEGGATAVEFAIVALPFFALVFAILETALVFFAGQALETAVANAARLVRTGQAQQQALSAATFKQKICDQISLIFNCGNVYIDVRKYANFGSISLTRPVDTNNNFKHDDFQYTPGVGGDIVVVRAYYEWPIYLNTLGNNLADLGDGKHLLGAAAAFRNEPFPW